MKKSKNTPVPLPGSKPKTLSQQTPSKQPLSNEYISDSDDSAAEEKAPSKAQKQTSKPKAPVNIAVHRPKTNGAQKKTEVPLPNQKSSSKKVVNGGPDSGSSSSEESDASVQVKDYPLPQTADEKSGDETEGSASGSNNSSSSSDESEDEATPAPTEQRTGASHKQPPSQTVQFRPVQPFVPPKGFTAVPTPMASSGQTTKIFENLDGKQIWHITAPADVPLSQLKEVAMDKALAGGVILTRKGIDYGFVAGDKNEQGAREVLIPRQNGYKAVSARITQTLHLQQVPRLPKLSSEQADQNTGSEAARSITASSIRAPRPQLKGLRMRYFHSGFGDPDPGILGDSESEDEEPSRTVTNGVQALNKPGKRKQEEVAGTEGAEAPVKKHKKHRTPEELKKREEKKAKKKKDKS